MSTILKALKKLEAEKRAAAPVQLAGNILVEPPGRSRRFRRLPLIAAGGVGGLLIAAAILGGYLWWEDGLPFAVGPASSVGPPVAMVSPPPSPVPAVAAGPAVVAKPLPKPVSEVAPGKPERPPSRLPARARVAAGATAGAGSMAPLPAKGVAGAAPVDQTLPGGKRGVAQNLAVTEIFPASGGDRQMAVVNGLPVMEGTIVEGAVVRKIGSGEVLFEIAGEQVVVPLRKAD